MKTRPVVYPYLCTRRELLNKNGRWREQQPRYIWIYEEYVVDLFIDRDGWRPTLDGIVTVTRAG